MKKNLLTFLLAAFAFVSPAAAQFQQLVNGANTTLSNLSSTAVNTDLLPNLNNSISVGSPVMMWKNLYLKNGLYSAGGRIFISDSNNTASGLNALINNTTGFANTAVGTGVLQLNTEGYSNSAIGQNALYSNTIGIQNTAAGVGAMYNNTSGSSNVAIGMNTLYQNISGLRNIAVGIEALKLNTSNDNTAVGYQSGLFNQTGGYNSSFGASAFLYNTTGTANTAIGAQSSYNNISGNHNTSCGFQSLSSNYYGGFNVAIGSAAMFTNTSASYSTAAGYSSMYYNTTGNYNSAHGAYSLYGNVTGNFNAAFGYNALSYNYNGLSNTAAGSYALYYNYTGSYNTAVGDHALHNIYYGSYNTAMGDYVNSSIEYISNSIGLGYNTIISGSNQVRVGNYYITSIGGYVGWSNVSDGRVKKNVKENIPGLSFINKLKPVSYNLDLDAADKIVRGQEVKDKDGKVVTAPVTPELTEARKAKQQIVYSGFIAQDVEKAAKELNYDFSGVDAAKNDKDLYGLRYAEFVVPLVKAVQELSKMNDEKDAQIAAMNERLTKLESLLQSTSVATSNENQQAVTISATSLEQNIPNPFKNTTAINYTLSVAYSSAQIIITGNNGKIVQTIQLKGSGKGSVLIDASSLSSGAYHYALYVNGKLSGSKQMLLVK